MASKRKVAPARKRGKASRPAHAVAGVTKAEWLKMTPRERLERHRATGWNAPVKPPPPPPRPSQVRVAALRRTRELIGDLESIAAQLDDYLGRPDEHLAPHIALVNELWAKRVGYGDLRVVGWLYLAWCIEQEASAGPAGEGFELFRVRYPERAEHLPRPDFAAAVTAWSTTRQWKAVHGLAQRCGLAPPAPHSMRTRYSKHMAGRRTVTNRT